MSRSVLSDILAAIVAKKIINESYGILLKDLPIFPYTFFIETLDLRIREHNLLRPNVFFVGFTEEEIRGLKAQLGNEYYSIPIYYSVEEAEDFRNAGSINSTSIVIAKRAVAKLTSLKWYETITAHEIYKELCNNAEKEFEVINDSLKNLWKALNSKKIMSIISLNMLIDYYQYLILNDENIPQQTVEQLYRLGLLIDDSLFKKKQVDSIRERLLNNSVLVSRISNLNKEDRKALQSQPESDIYYSTRSNILQFYSTRDIEVLGKLKYNEVLDLLTKVRSENRKNQKSSDDGNGQISTTTDHRRQEDNSPDTTGVELIIEHETEKVKGLLDGIEEEYNEWEKGKRSKVKVENEDTGTRVEFIPEIYNLIDTFVGEDAFGGVILADLKNPTDALRSIDQFKINILKNKDIDEIKEILLQLENEFNEAEGLSKIFELFISSRNMLVSSARRLADSPILKIVETEEMVQLCNNYIDSYGRLLKKIKEHYSLFSSFSPRGSKQLIASINSIDMVYIIGESNIHSTMTPLYPLYLWKYVELTIRLRESSSSLNEIDKEFLVRKSAEIPNPLSTVFISNYISNKGDRVIPEVSFIGNLPLYSSEQQVNQTIDGLKVVENCIAKFIRVYPHSSFGLRVAFVNPPSVKHVLDIFKGFVKDTSIEFKGAHIHIFKTKETPENWASFDEIDDVILNKFAVSIDPSFSVKVESAVIGFEQLRESIKRNNFHLVAMFDPSGRSVSNTKRDPLLKIHPLCIPKVFDYDPIADKVEIIPASDGNIFSDHHDLLSRLNDKPQGWHHTVVLEMESTKKEFEELLNAVPWLIIADSNLKNLELSVIGSENCIYYESKSYRDIGVYTKDWDKLSTGMVKSIRSLGNYDPNPNCVANILRTMQGLNEKGVLQLASSKYDHTFNINHTKGALGTTISAIYARQDKTNYIIVSLDTDLSQNWLDERENGDFSDLVGIRFNGNHADIDIFEVKTYDGAYIRHEDSNEISGKAVDQVNSVRDLINEIFSERDKITSTSRRELLRFQVFRAFHQLPLSKKDKKEWTYQLNRLFAGEIPVNIHLYIHHVRFSEQGLTETNQYTSEHLINLVEIRDDFINKVLVNCNDINFEGTFNELNGIYEKQTNTLNKQNLAKRNADNSILSNNGINLSQENISNPEKKEVNGINHQDQNIEDNEEVIISDDNNDEFIKSIERIASTLFRAMKDYSIDVASIDPKLALVAARFVRFRVRLRAGETLQKVLRYRTDISREIEAESEILVGNERGTQYIFVDVPRKNTDSIMLIEQLKMLPIKEPVGNLNVIIGQDPSGEFKLLNIAQAPHILTAGSTGSGKTIFLYSIIVSLISQYSKEELEFVIIDPKQTDFIFFEGLPHLRNGEVILEAEKAVEILTDLTENELEKRTEMLRQSRSRDLFSYNQKNSENPMKPIIVIIDEYADLVQVADLEGRKKDFERQMIRLAQRSRNVGIHLVVATQRPSADIVTSNLKTNIPCRISFRLPAHQDSMTILDLPGAEDLLGKGDMLFSLNGEITRLQGLFISEEELEDYLNV